VLFSGFFGLRQPQCSACAHTLLLRYSRPSWLNSHVAHQPAHSAHLSSLEFLKTVPACAGGRLWDQALPVCFGMD